MGALNAGSELVKACELAWEHIRSLHPEIGRAVIVVGSGGRKAPRLLGHFIPEKWELDSDASEPEKVHEVLLVAENLRREADEVFTTLLHESVHALAHAKDVKDVSGQRHNRRFARLCKEVGLVPPEKPDPSLGFSAATLDTTTRYLYMREIRQIGEALKLCRSMTLIPKAAQTSFKAKCQCERTLRLSKKTINEGPLVCGMCEEQFKLEEEG